MAGFVSLLGCRGARRHIPTRFDTIKTRLQCSPPGTYKGAVDCLLKTVRNESIFALYKGATPPAVGWAAIDSLLLGSLHNYRLFLIRKGFTELTPGSDTKRLTLLGHGIAGLFAGWTSKLDLHELNHRDIVKLQLQLQRTTVDRVYKGPIDCGRQVVRAHGVLGLWIGFTGSLAFRSNFFWMFGGFEALMRGFSKLDGTPYAEVSTPTANFLSGGLAAFGYWIMAIPADNIKKYATARQILAEGGFRGYYRGLGPTLLRAFPVNASALWVYEGLMRVLGAEKSILTACSTN
ncbi:mitochondrial carrier [Trametes meyenii]|nr:mitochondrial carrier [Trametes meyenii]